MSSVKERPPKHRIFPLAAAAICILLLASVHGFAAGERERAKTLSSLSPEDFLVRVKIVSAPSEAASAASSKPGSDLPESDLLGPEGTLFQVELPAESLLGSMHKATPDVCVFNAGGKSMPFTLRPQGWQDTRKTYRVDTLFPIWGNAKITENELAVSFGLDAQGRLIPRISGGAPGAKAPQGKELKGYVIPLPEAGIPVSSMQFAWDKGAEATVQFTLQTGDDLKTWETLMDNVALVRFDGPDSPLESSQVSLKGRRAGKYLRMLFDTGLAPAAVHSVSIEQWSSVRKIKEYGPLLPRLMPEEETKMSGNRRIPSKAAALEYSLSSPNPEEARAGKGALPLEALQLHNPKPGQYATVKVFVRAGEDDAWRYVDDYTFFAIMRGGDLLSALPLPLGGRAVGQIRLESVVPGKVLPEHLNLSVQYRPADLFFLAQGPGPYFLAWGAEKGIPRDDADIFSLITGGGDVKKAALGTIVQPPVEDNGAKDFSWSEGTWLKYALWALLVVGVLLLAGMTVQLIHTMRSNRG